MRIVLPAIVALLSTATIAFAQTAEEMPEAEVERQAELEQREAKQELAEAEAQLAEAAQRVAELSMRNLPRQFYEYEGFKDLLGKPRLGVTVSTDDMPDAPVEGVEIIGITPGGAAAEAGLRTGDVLTSVAEEPLGADSSKEAYTRLMAIVKAFEEGDKVDVEYLRDGRVGKVTVKPRVIKDMPSMIVELQNARDWENDIRVIPERMGNAMQRLAVRWGGSSWADMELVELTAGLGKYFGTDEGLLVVAAPKSGALELEDGDVIKQIDGRTPTSINHAIRILGSYQPGEKLELSIMRDKRRRTLTVEMPDDRTSLLAPMPRLPRVSPVSPVSPVPPVPQERPFSHPTVDH